MKSKQGKQRGYPNRSADTLASVAQLNSPIAGTRIRREEAMSEIGLEAVLLMIGMVMLMMCFWKQIAIFLLFAIITVFCFGVYYIASTIGLYVT
jgi:hypothetical protein